MLTKTVHLKKNSFLSDGRFSVLVTEPRISGVKYLNTIWEVILSCVEIGSFVTRDWGQSSGFMQSHILFKLCRWLCTRIANTKETSRKLDISLVIENTSYGPRQANLVLITYASSESRGTFRQKARSLASLNGWACAVKTCHDGMLEDTNSLDSAHMLKKKKKVLRRRNREIHSIW